MLITLEIGKIEKKKDFKISLMSNIKIAIIQMRMVSSRVKNLKNAINKIRIAHQKGAQVICLPELFLTNYFCQVEKHSNFKLAEKIPGPTSDILCSLCLSLIHI